MPAKAYNIDQKRRRSQHTWEGLPEGAYVLIDKLTLIDESSNFDQNPFQVRDNLRYQTHYPDEVEFRLLGYFDAPRTREDVEGFFETGLSDIVSDSDLIAEDLEQYMNRILGLGLLKPATLGATGELWEMKGKPITFRAPHIQKHDKVVRSFPTTVAINLTEQCNLSCLHCCVGSGPTVSSANDMTPAELSRVFTELEEGGALTVRLTGGETTVRPDFWEILEDAASRRFSLVLFTNGSRINEEGAQRLKMVSEAKGSRFSVHLSLDGGSAETHDFLRNRKGNFAKVIHTMELLHAHGVHFFVESVLTSKSFTAEEVDRMATIVNKYGVTWCSFHPADQVGNAEGEDSVTALSREDKIRLQLEIQPVIEKWKPLGLQILFSSYNYPLSEPTRKVKGAVRTKLSGGRRSNQPNDGAPWEAEFRRDLDRSRSSGHSVCTAGVAQFALGADGQVYGCPRYVGDSDNAMGSVREASLVDIWNSDRWDWVREDYSSKLNLCQHCDYQTNCFYGKTCRANPGRVFKDRYGVGTECIQEHQKLGIPASKVVGYLKERIELFPDDVDLVQLCERLLSQTGEGEHKGTSNAPAVSTGAKN